jgi:hypothetical protein
MTGHRVYAVLPFWGWLRCWLRNLVLRRERPPRRLLIAEYVVPTRVEAAERLWQQEPVTAWEQGS